MRATCWPVWHNVPPYCEVHSQRNVRPSRSSWHDAPFWQGWLAHSSSAQRQQTASKWRRKHHFLKETWSTFMPPSTVVLAARASLPVTKYPTTLPTELPWQKYPITLPTELSRQIPHNVADWTSVTKIPYNLANWTLVTKIPHNVADWTPVTKIPYNVANWTLATNAP